MTEQEVIAHFGIDAEGSSTCFACDLRHYSGMACPPVLPFGTDSKPAWDGAIW